MVKDRHSYLRRRFCGFIGAGTCRLDAVQSISSVWANDCGVVVTQKVCRLNLFHSLVGKFCSGLGILLVKLIDDFRKRSWKLPLSIICSAF